MKPSSALIIGGAYLSYTIASWSTERREAVVQMIRDGVSGAVNAFLEDPVGCLRRFWEEKKRSSMLLLALASKLMADNLRRKRLKGERARRRPRAAEARRRRAGRSGSSRVGPGKVCHDAAARIKRVLPALRARSANRPCDGILGVSYI